MKLLIDEDLHRSIVSVFQDLGFVVFDVRDIGLRGEPDDKIFDWAQKKNAILVSADLGFSNILRFPKHNGIIILRFPNELSTMIINREVKRLLMDLNSEDYKSNLLIVSSGKVRIKEAKDMR